MKKQGSRVFGRPKTGHPNLCESLYRQRVNTVSLYTLPLPLFPFLLHSHSRPSLVRRTIYRFLHPRFCIHAQIKSNAATRSPLMNEKVSFAPGNQEGWRREKGEGGIFKFAFTPRSQPNPLLSLSFCPRQPSFLLSALQTTAPSKWTRKYSPARKYKRDLYRTLPLRFYLFIYLFILSPPIRFHRIGHFRSNTGYNNDRPFFFFYTVNVFFTFSKFLEIFTLFEMGKNEGNFTRVNVTLLCSVQDLKDIRSKFLNYRKRKYFCLWFQRKSRPLLLFITRRENVVPREIVTTYVFNPN